MKITTFNPLIISPNADAIISLFEELGFEKRHAPVVETGDRTVQRTRMKDANGFYVDISQLDSISRDMTAMRMNVDSIDEAYALLTSRGFKPAPGTEEVDPKNARAMLMVSPSGFAIEIIEHVK
jgi:hypothetical protein